ncbi:hypothetical protein SUGI_0770840 [Cryptomeria japonica]|nr:hypothetical protein SUGI_0770840 [Cryptomeria japonica]
MIAGYVQCGQGEEALNIFADMLKEGVNVNQFTFSSAFGACAIEECLIERTNEVRACASLVALELGRMCSARSRKGSP